MLKVLNVWDMNAPVIVDYHGEKYTIPHDGYIYFLPEELRDHDFKGLLKILPDNLPLKKHYPIIFRGIMPPEKKKVDEFTKRYEYVEPPAPDYDTPKDKTLVETFKKEIPAEFKGFDVKEDEEVVDKNLRPLAGKKVNQKLRDQRKRKSELNGERLKKKRLGIE
jgi:hypothetical protein